MLAGSNYQRGLELPWQPNAVVIPWVGQVFVHFNDLKTCVHWLIHPIEDSGQIVHADVLCRVDAKACYLQIMHRGGLCHTQFAVSSCIRYVLAHAVCNMPSRLHGGSYVLLSNFSKVLQMEDRQALFICIFQNLAGYFQMQKWLCMATLHACTLSLPPKRSAC